MIDIDYCWPVCDDCGHPWVDHGDDHVCDLRDICLCDRYWPAGLRREGVGIPNVDSIS